MHRQRTWGHSVAVHRPKLNADGYEVIESAVTIDELECQGRDLASMLELPTVATQSSNGHNYAARNFLDVLPASLRLHENRYIRKFLVDTLGDEFGLVRGLYFDKSPTANWALDWHRDKSIAVLDNTIVVDGYKKPTFKHGTPHIEPPEAVLEQMLTLRLHLDPMTMENGPLRVRPGSHHLDSVEKDNEVPMNLNAGDVLAMRPLLLHASSSAIVSSNKVQRRVLHLEFARRAALIHPLQWHNFIQ